MRPRDRSWQTENMFQKPSKQPITITYKTPAEIEKMREAGQLAANVLDMIGPYVQEGITTEELDRICHDYMVNVQKVIPAPLNYRGFPKSICTSVNHVVCHGIPGPKKLKKGDVLNIDITVIKDGYHGDTSRMFAIGAPPIAAQRVCRIAYECLCIGIEAVRPGIRLGDIGYAIQKHAEAQHCSVVREYCGHGIGRDFHEDPQVLHYGKPGEGVSLVPGMTFTIEPMINAGKRHVKLLPDGWTVITKDHSISAQWEHTVLVTETGHEILTLSPDTTL
ncbi:MAG TPA: type I methionyl aminopeptidase [Candidatus Competibacteraceae bacterium]|nr:type I methionyl aminopeptidase [Candidatus Competibacteraceae bacterium]